MEKGVLDATKRAKIGSLQDINCHVNDICFGALHLFYESFYAAGFTPEWFRLHISSIDCYYLDVSNTNEDLLVITQNYGSYPVTNWHLRPI